MDCFESCKPVSSIILRIIVDVVCVVLAHIPRNIVRSLEKSPGPFMRGFFCDDESIRYPYRNDTVNMRDLFIGGYSIPVALIVVTEVLRYILHDRFLARHLSRYRVTGTCSVPILFAALYRFLMLFVFGAGIVLSISGFSKLIIGRPRPHFIDVCQPDLARLNCTMNSHNFVYLDEFTCTGTYPKRITDARLSFPSTHSTFAWFSAVFTVCYLQSRFKWTGSRLLRPLIQSVLVGGALAVSLSRISDYKHHWSDVLGGSVLGITFGSFAILHLSGVFKYPEQFKPAGSSSTASKEIRPTSRPPIAKLTEFDDPA